MSFLPIGTIIEHNDELNPNTGRLWQGEIFPRPKHAPLESDMGLAFHESNFSSIFSLGVYSYTKNWHVVDIEPED